MAEQVSEPDVELAMLRLQKIAEAISVSPERSTIVGFTVLDFKQLAEAIRALLASHERLRQRVAELEAKR